MVKRALCPLLLRTGVYERMIEKHHHNKLAILWCHRVRGDELRQSGMTSLRFEEGVKSSSFEDLIRFLRSRMHPVSMGDVVNFVNGVQPIPSRAVAVMLDDGYMDNYLNAFPILRRYGVPATIFLVTGYIGTGSIFWWDRIGEILKRTNHRRFATEEVKRCLNGTANGLPVEVSLTSTNAKNKAWRLLTASLKQCEPALIDEAVTLMERELGVKTEDFRHHHATLNWAQVREMSENGIDFGAHTVTHASLRSLPLARVMEEVLESKQAIETETGKPVVSLTYPYGDHPDAAGVVPKLAASGFDCAFLSQNGYICPKSDPFALKRIALENLPVPVIVRELTAALKKDSG